MWWVCAELLATSCQVEELADEELEGLRRDSKGDLRWGWAEPEPADEAAEAHSGLTSCHISLFPAHDFQSCAAARPTSSPLYSSGL
eukprot:9224935-Alexandrium_andersonii.AAC.1